jgi:hypothetical protein
VDGVYCVMSIPDDLLIQLATDAADGRPKRSRMAAFVPITVALIGVAIVLVGGVSARNFDTASSGVDPMITGSVAPGAETELR